MWGKTEKSKYAWDMMPKGIKGAMPWDVNGFKPLAPNL